MASTTNTFIIKNLLGKLCLFNLLFIFWVDVSAQSDSLKIDSLQKILQTRIEDTNRVNTLNVLCKAYWRVSDYRKELQYANQALALANTVGFKKGEAEAYINAGQANDYLGNYPEALGKKYAALKIYEETGDKKGTAKSLQFIGAGFIGQGDDAKALKNLLPSLKIHGEIGDTLSMAQNYNSIGEIYSRQGNYAVAFEKFSAALTIYQKMKDRAPFWGLPWCYGNIGIINEKRGDSALAKGNKDNAAIRYSEALKNYLVALKLNQTVKRKDAAAESYNILGNLYIKIGKPVIAKDYLQKGLNLSKEVGLKTVIAGSYNSLSRVSSIQGNYKQAYEHYKMYILYRDSLNNEESNRKFEQTQMQYEFDKKEAVAKEAQAKKDLEANRVKNLQYITIASLAAVVLTVLIIAFIQWRNNQLKQKANIVLQQQKQKVESTLAELKSTQAQLIQSEKMASLGELTAGIAHEIQNPLNFVNNFSDVNKELLVELKDEADKGNIDEVKAIANDVITNEEKINLHGKRADAIVKGMLQHSRTSSGKKEPTDINALADEYLRLSYHGLRAKDKDFNVTMNTDFDKSIGKINVIPQDIGRVLLNLYNNAFYAVKPPNPLKGEQYKPLVTVTTRKLNSPSGVGSIEITVSDNGNGVPQNIINKIFQPFFTTKPTGQGTGLGLSLSYDIITKEHNGTIKVESKEGEGTMFIICLS